jgi:hypothetical protein
MSLLKCWYGWKNIIRLNNYWQQLNQFKILVPVCFHI